MKDDLKVGLDYSIRRIHSVSNDLRENLSQDQFTDIPSLLSQLETEISRLKSIFHFAKMEATK